MEWVSFLLAPTVAAIQVGVGYALVKPACAGGSVAPLTTLSVVMAVAAIAGALIGWRVRGRFLGVLGAGLNILVLLLIVASTASHFIFHPCD
jgi:hypothetical protein